MDILFVYERVPTTIPVVNPAAAILTIPHSHHRRYIGTLGTLETSARSDVFGALDWIVRVEMGGNSKSFTIGNEGFIEDILWVVISSSSLSNCCANEGSGDENSCGIFAD